MGLTGKGMLDNFNGAVGTVVGSSWRNRKVMRSRPVQKRNRKFSEAQLIQQARMKTVMIHLQAMTKVISKSFTDYTKERTGFNSAVSHAINEALTGVYPDYSLEWGKVQISRGKLLPAKTSSAVANGSIIQFTWSTEVVTSDTNPLDRAILVVYCPELYLCFYDLSTFTRAAGTGQVDANYFEGKVVHAYIGFITEKGNRSSVSKYLGEFTL
jgi:hypothetical protein